MLALESLLGVASGKTQKQRMLALCACYSLLNLGRGLILLVPCPDLEALVTKSH